MKTNTKYLKIYVKSVDDIIFAWGTNTIKHRTGKEYKTTQSKVKSICKCKTKLMVAGGRNEPLHGQRWSNTSGFVSYKEM